MPPFGPCHVVNELKLLLELSSATCQDSRQVTNRYGNGKLENGSTSRAANGDLSFAFELRDLRFHGNLHRAAIRVGDGTAAFGFFSHGLELGRGNALEPICRYRQLR